MRTLESPLFTATSLLAGLSALGLSAWFVAQRPDAVTEHWLDLVLLGVFALVSYLLSFSSTGGDRISLELAYFIAAVLVLPFPAPILVAAGSALVGSVLRGRKTLGVMRLISVAGANLAIATAMTLAACVVVSMGEDPVRAWWASVAPTDTTLAARVGSRLVPNLLLAGVLFLVMNLVNLIMMGVWMMARRQSPGAHLRRFVFGILPFELVNIPFACLLALSLRTDSGIAGYLMLAVVGLVLSLALKRLSDSEETLNRASSQLDERLAQISALGAIGRAMSTSLDAARIFEIVREECHTVFRADVVSIASLDPDSLELKLESSSAGDVPWKTTMIGRAQGPTALVLDTEQPLLLGDAPTELAARQVDFVGIEPGIRSVAAVPLMVDTRAVGVLSVQSFSPGAYAQTHLSLLGTMGQQIAGAIDNARHYRLANVDHLTGLFQRDFFFQRLGDEHRRAARYGTAFSLLMLDVDGLRSVNARFGHAAGDRVLQNAGRRIKGLLRSPDLPCRYSGGKFCILLPETEAGGARVLAEKIRGDIAALRLAEGDHAIPATVSVGISCFPVHFEGSVPGLIQKAERALTHAKIEGRNRVSLSAA